MRAFMTITAVAALLSLHASIRAQAMPASKAPTAAEKKAVAFLIKQQDAEGGWTPAVGPAITAMVVRGLVESGTPVSDPAVAKGLAFIETMKQKDGGYYKDTNPNYNSALVLSLYASLPEGKTKYKDQIAGLQKFLKSIQMDETKDVSGKHLADVPGGKPIDKENPWYGGAGYGATRPDLSNTAYLLDALHESGTPSTDPAIQKALIFVSRNQNLGETNPLPFAKKATDGGFIYSTNAGGESKFPDITTPEGDILKRSYGSMTYAGLKSMLYAGVTKDDVRVKAAVKWIQNNWTLEFNPGANSAEGQFYFYHTFAKSLNAWGEPVITDSKGVRHDWRAELLAALNASQKEDGSWVNTKAERWMEGNPVLATAYAVLALQEARK
jgi:squalene-hopene/tetraprenyl-beta-curcumene cyclase